MAQTWLPIILASIQTVFTVLAFFRTSNSAMRKKSNAPKWGFIILTGLTWLVIGYGYYTTYEPRIAFWLNGGKLETIADQSFSNTTIVLDGHTYTHCKFENVTFQVNGGPFGFSNNYVHGVHFTSTNQDINSSIEIFARLGLLKVLVQGSDGKQVESGVTWSN